MEDMERDIMPDIKIEIKEEEVEDCDPFVNYSCYDWLPGTDSIDNEIKIKNEVFFEPWDFYEVYDKSVEFEIKQELDCDSFNPKVKKKFICHHCKRSFCRLQNLKWHSRIHFNPQKPILISKKMQKTKVYQKNLIIYECPKARKKFICYHCKRSFCRFQNLKWHIRLHFKAQKPILLTKKFHKSKIYKKKSKIDYCPKVRKKFICYHCKRSFCRFQNLKWHIRLHLKAQKPVLLTKKLQKTKIYQKKSRIDYCPKPRKKFICYHCGRSFNRLKNLKWHIRRHFSAQRPVLIAKKMQKRKIYQKKLKIHKCKYCGGNYKVLEKLKKHILIHHKQEISRFCKLCNYMTNKVGELRKHVQVCHTDTVSYYSCSRCEFRSRSIRKFARHALLRHKDVKLFQCLLSTSGALKLSTVRRETRGHTDGNTYLCKLCGFKTITKNDLKLHSISEHPIKDINQCQLCDFVSPRSADLKRHMMSLHLVLKPYHCQLCDFRGVKSSDLTRHMMDRHSNRKPHKCNFCDYKAKRAEHLRIHLQRHLDSSRKLHPCHQCKYTTTFPSSLRRHVKMKHLNNNPYQCTLCEFSSLQFHIIKRHINNKHF